MSVCRDHRHSRHHTTDQLHPKTAKPPTSRLATPPHLGRSSALCRAAPLLVPSPFVTAKLPPYCATSCAGIVDRGSVLRGLRVCLPIMPSPTIIQLALDGTPLTTMKNIAGPGAANFNSYPRMEHSKYHEAHLESQGWAPSVQHAILHSHHLYS